MWVSRNEYYGQNVFFEIMIIMPVMLLVTMMKMLATKWILMRTNHFLIWTRGEGGTPHYTEAHNRVPQYKGAPRRNHFAQKRRGVNFTRG